MCRLTKPYAKILATIVAIPLVPYQHAILIQSAQPDKEQMAFYPPQGLFRTPVPLSSDQGEERQTSSLKQT